MVCKVNMRYCAEDGHMVPLGQIVATIRPVILDFQKFEILTAGSIRMANMRYRAIFHADRSNYCRDMAGFRIFKMTAGRHLGFIKVGNFNFQYGSEGQFAVRHLRFVVRLLQPSTKRSWWSLSLCKIWLESAYCRHNQPCQIF